MQVQLIKIIFLSVLLTALSACSGGMNKTQTGTLGGAAAGAGIGAIIGDATGNTGAGIAIGAATGAIGGAIIGNELDEQDRSNAELEEQIRRA